VRALIKPEEAAPVAALQRIHNRAATVQQGRHLRQLFSKRRG
jgi:hypothetical protein